MTFTEFQATRRDVEDLGTIEHIAGAGVQGEGSTYLDDQLFLECATCGTMVPVYTLTIGNYTESTEDLERLERELYEFAVSEGYVE
jgi:hypothetical protein